MRTTALVSLVVALSGCSAAAAVEAPRTAEQPAGVSQAQPSPASTAVSLTRPATCIGLLPETEIRIEETTHGAALVFTTDDDIAALRDGVAQRIVSLGLANAHLDNVNNGVRIVFESASDGRSKVREMVVLRGRELSKTCDLAWDTRNDTPPKEEPAAVTATPVKPETTASDDKSKSTTPADADKKKQEDDAKGKDKSKADAKPPETKPTDKKVEKPKDGDKLKPKAPPLPPPPNLPPPPAPPPPPGPRPF